MYCNSLTLGTRGFSMSGPRAGNYHCLEMCCALIVALVQCFSTAALAPPGSFGTSLGIWAVAVFGESFYFVVKL